MVDSIARQSAETICLDKTSEPHKSGSHVGGESLDLPVDSIIQGCDGPRH